MAGPVNGAQAASACTCGEPAPLLPSETDVVQVNCALGHVAQRAYRGLLLWPPRRNQGGPLAVLRKNNIKMYKPLRCVATRFVSLSSVRLGTACDMDH